MTQLDLGLGELRISLALLDREVEGQGETNWDWLICEAKVEVPNFSGLFRCNLLRADLEALASGLCGLHSQVPERGQFTFESSEGDISLNLRLEHTGQITGRYKLRPSYHSAELHGSINIDQSFLPDLVQRIHGFLRGAKDAA